MTRPTPVSPPTGMVAGDSNRRLKWVKVRLGLHNAHYRSLTNGSCIRCNYSRSLTWQVLVQVRVGFRSSSVPAAGCRVRQSPQVTVCFVHLMHDSTEGGL